MFFRCDSRWRRGGEPASDAPARRSSRTGRSVSGLFSVAARPSVARWPSGAMRRCLPRFVHLESIAYAGALVACGEIDALIALNPVRPWDVAAMDLIVQEAGGLVTERRRNGRCAMMAKRGFPRYWRPVRRFTKCFAAGSRRTTMSRTKTAERGESAEAGQGRRLFQGWTLRRLLRLVYLRLLRSTRRSAILAM